MMNLAELRKLAVTTAWSDKKPTAVVMSLYGKPCILGYLFVYSESRYIYVQAIAVDRLKGGYHIPDGEVVLVHRPEEVRLATKEDFEKFRLAPSEVKHYNLNED